MGRNRISLADDDPLTQVSANLRTLWAGIFTSLLCEVRERARVVREIRMLRGDAH